MNPGSDSTLMARGIVSTIACRSAIVTTLVLLIVAAFSPSATANGSVEPRFDLTDPSRGPFPSDRFTVPDATQLTGLRVNLPKADCAIRRSDCEDIDVLNTLDGFNLQPRLSIPFTGPIDPASVSSDTVFLFKLSCTSCPGVNVVGINQAVWDPETNTLHVESDQLLDQDARYLLVVTNGIRTQDGERIDSDQFRDVLHAGQTNDPAEAAYRQQLLAALDRLKAAGVSAGRVAAASIFTTQSATAMLEKIRDQIHAATPAPADFAIGTDGERTVFPLADVTDITFLRQVGTAPIFRTDSVSLKDLRIVPGAVGTVAFGRYHSPDYETPAGVIPAVGTLTGTPSVQRTNEVYFNLFLPSGPEPPGGWPVVIAGHGNMDNKNTGNNPVRAAAKLTQHGLAAITINAVGHGGGSLGTLTVTSADGTAVTLPAGGRGVDQNGDGAIGASEGLYTAPNGPQALVGGRDGDRQTVVDLIQLVREIQVGIDADGDSAPDLDPSRIYYFGNSLGGVYGLPFVAAEPDVRAGVLGAVGGSLADWRLGISGARVLMGEALSLRSPRLDNGGPDPIQPSNPFPFWENLPLRHQPTLVNDVAGAIAIQEWIEHLEWAMQPADPLVYAPHLRSDPLAGLSRKRVLISFAKGDPICPNSITTALLRAGDLADRTMYFRGDLAYAPNQPTAQDLHGYLFRFTPAGIGFALAGQEAIGTFLASDGNTTIDPDPVDHDLDPATPPRDAFEVPIVGPLPEDLSFST
jgi:dienelactone hydrolase